LRRINKTRGFFSRVTITTSTVTAGRGKSEVNFFFI